MNFYRQLKLKFWYQKNFFNIAGGFQDCDPFNYLKNSKYIDYFIHLIFG